MLGIVVPFWNPFGNADRVENLERCLAILRAAPNVRVLCVETAHQDRSSGLADIVLTGAPDSIYIWQKERLVNYGCTMLADQGSEYLGYVDSDCLFADSQWPSRIVERFEQGCNIVQGFSRAVGDDNVVPAALAAFPRMANRLHGGSMFLHRDLFARVSGFYEYCIVGGGDFVLMMAVTGDFRSMEWVFPNDAYRDHAARWMDLFRDTDIRPACAGNDIAILGHGNPRRSHRMRHALLVDFVPEEDIVRTETLGLTERGARLLPRLRAYSAHREDRPDMIAR
jgi:hypothetical protein